MLWEVHESSEDPFKKHRVLQRNRHMNDKRQQEKYFQDQLHINHHEAGQLPKPNKTSVYSSKGLRSFIAEAEDKKSISNGDCG